MEGEAPCIRHHRLLYTGVTEARSSVGNGWKATSGLRLRRLPTTSKRPLPSETLLASRNSLLRPTPCNDDRDGEGEGTLSVAYSEPDSDGVPSGLMYRLLSSPPQFGDGTGMTYFFLRSIAFFSSLQTLDDSSFGVISISLDMRIF